jgi:hypothetical protein
MRLMVAGLQQSLSANELDARHPGVLSFGRSTAEAMSKAEVLALGVIADRLDNNESEPVRSSLSLPVSACVLGHRSKR